jgi:hypothetical protein
MSAHVTHKDRTPVFVVGHARSGTTILTKLIRKHLHIAFGTESQFIVRQATRAGSFGDLAVESNRRRFVEELSAERFFARTRRNYRYEIDIDGVVRASAAGTYRSIIDAIFGQLAGHMGFGRWGDKTPDYAHHLPELYTLYPDASYIHVIRDGRDVALSTFETHFGAKNVHVAAREWRECLEAVERFRLAYPAARIHDLRYEDLLNRPSEVFGSLIEFLRIDGHNLASRVATAVSEEVWAANSQKWRSRLSEDEQRRFEAVAGGVLDRYGYERVARSVPAPNRLENAYWTVDNVMRRVRTSGYWQDTLYGLGLRLGAVRWPLRRRRTGSHRSMTSSSTDIVRGS